MFCSKCGNQVDDGVQFCRGCGADLGSALIPRLRRSLATNRGGGQELRGPQSKDLDELTAAGIANVIIGDGFFMAAVLLSATHGNFSSVLWLLLLIPAFFFFGKGFADVLHSRQIQRRRKQEELKSAADVAELPPTRVSFIDVIKRHTSGDLLAAPSVTERTTRDLS